MAIYNNGYPLGYPQYGAGASYAPAVGSGVAGAVNSSLIWVQGETGAKSYLVGPGQTVALWDSEATKIYIKSADSAGMPSMRVIEYTIQDEVAAPANKDLEAIRQELTAMRRDIDKLMKGETKDESTL
ncbi:MAG: hypothetical protein IKR26_03365 [Lachnospiraceae bacterium]|nr:hypothetical protein [Lachnospiraceae bacterium]